MAFCKDYNAKTADKVGIIVPVEIIVFEDKSFIFKLKTPPTSVLIKKEVSLKKGASNPGKQQVGIITVSQIEKIAKSKLINLNCVRVKSAIRTVMGTSMNMAI